MGSEMCIRDRCQSNELDTFRSFEVRQVNDGADFSVSQVDFDELWQVLGFAGHVDLGNDVRDLAAGLDRGFFTDEVNWNLGGQLLASNDANEVGVHDEAFGRVTLHGLDHDVLLGAVDIQFDNVAEGSFVFEQLGDFLGHDGQGLGFFIATVDNGRDVGGVTQAAARTFPQVSTRLGVQSEFCLLYTSPSPRDS